MFAIWLLPNKDDTNYLSDIIHELSYKLNSPEFSPHITVYGIVKTNQGILEEAITNILKNLKPFIVKKSRVKHSDFFWKTIFIDITPNRELNFINSKLSNYLSKYANYDFSPHISLVYKKMEIHERIKIIENLSLKDKFTIGNIAIQKYSDNVNEWKIVRNYNI